MTVARLLMFSSYWNLPWSLLILYSGFGVYVVMAYPVPEQSLSGCRENGCLFKWFVLLLCGVMVLIMLKTLTRTWLVC